MQTTNRAKNLPAAFTLSLVINLVGWSALSNILIRHAQPGSQPILIDELIGPRDKAVVQTLRPSSQATQSPSKTAPKFAPRRVNQLVGYVQPIAKQTATKEVTTRTSQLLTRGTQLSSLKTGEQQISPPVESIATGAIQASNEQNAPAENQTSTSNPAPSPVATAAPAPHLPGLDGPTTNAFADNRVLPTIPLDVTDDDYNSSVRVTVSVHADGTFDVNLLDSSGNDEVDQNVLDALKKWRWKPALLHGTPIDSKQNFRFEFVVH